MALRTRLFYQILLSLLVFQLSLTPVSAGDDKCAAEGFFCPNCGGTIVSSCLSCDGYLNTDYKNEVCFERSLFGPRNDDHTDPENYYDFLWNDVVGTLVWFLAAGVATACGVGGGGIYVPAGMLLLRFAPKPASGLSQASIFGASLGGLILNLRNNHPNTRIREKEQLDAEGKSIPLRGSTVQLKKADDDYVQSGGVFYTRPLIDYDMALFLAPMEMAGAVLGVLIQKILPNWAYLMMAGVILGVTAYKTFGKYHSSHAKEKEERIKQDGLNRQEDSKHSHQGSGTDQMPTEELVSMQEEGFNTDVEDEEEGSQEDKHIVSSEVVPADEATAESLSSNEAARLRRQYLELDARHYPREKLITLGVLWMGLVLLTFMKGGKGVESLVGITCESPWFAVLIVCQFLWTLGFALYLGLQLPKRVAERKKVQYPFQPTDVMWDNQKLRFYATFTFVAGIVAGLIGIGGGMVLGPLMLSIGIHPRVSSATTATMVVLTSSSVAILFVTAGLVPWSYAVYFFCVCFIGAYIGKKYIDGYVKKSGRASLLILILAIIIALATIGCFVIVLTNLSRKNWCFDGLQDFCDVKDDKTCGVARVLKGEFSFV